MSQLTAPGLEYAQALLASCREELERADGKASVILAAAGIFLGALVAAVLAGDWSPFDVWNGIEWLLWMSLAMALLGIAALAYCVFPRTTYRRKNPDYIGYFGDVVATPTHKLLDAIEATAQDTTAAVLHQLTATAHIADRKYRSLRVALTAFSSAAVMALLSIVVDQLVKSR